MSYYPVWVGKWRKKLFSGEEGGGEEMLTQPKLEGLKPVESLHFIETEGELYTAPSYRIRDIITTEKRFEKRKKKIRKKNRKRYYERKKRGR